MIPDWIIWSVIFTGLLTLIALALCVTTVAVYLLQIYRTASPAKQLHRMGKALTSSPDRERRQVGFALIKQAHILDLEACGCPRSPVVVES